MSFPTRSGSSGSQGFSRRSGGGGRRFGPDRGRGGSSGGRRFGPRQDLAFAKPTPGELANLRQLAAEAKEQGTGFSKLELSELLLGALQSMKFMVPTPIQEKAIPLALANQDILGCAQTGTGKTLAFLVPVIEHLLREPNGSALILVPTRELGLQIEEVMKPLAKKLDLGIPTLLIGGVSYVHQFRLLNLNPRLVVATPGRLIDHLGQGTISLDKVTHLVLDEADRMLDVGFKPQLNEILTFLKTKPQTMLFTATLSRDVRSLAQQYLKNPAQLQVGNANAVNADITQTKMEVDQARKAETVLDLLTKHPGTALLFVKTQIKTEKVADMLANAGVVATPIHGGLTQGQRKRALESFRDEKIRVLVATDVAARGLDIDHVNLVINFDLPQVPEDYVHRIGRTGRAGRKGNAISLVSRDEAHLWRLIARQFLPGTEKDSRPGTAGGAPRGGGYGRRPKWGAPKPASRGRFPARSRA